MALAVITSVWHPDFLVHYACLKVKIMVWFIDVMFTVTYPGFVLLPQRQAITARVSRYSRVWLISKFPSKMSRMWHSRLLVRKTSEEMYYSCFSVFVITSFRIEVFVSQTASECNWSSPILSTTITSNMMKKKVVGLPVIFVQTMWWNSHGQLMKRTRICCLQDPDWQPGTNCQSMTQWLEGASWCSSTWCVSWEHWSVIQVSHDYHDTVRVPLKHVLTLE